jgi:hypothetical protein
VFSTSGHGGANAPDSSADEGLEVRPSTRGNGAVPNVRPPTSVGGDSPLGPRIERWSAAAHRQRRRKESDGTSAREPGRNRDEAARAVSPRDPPDQPEGRPPRNHLVGASRPVALQPATLPRESGRESEDRGGARRKPGRSRPGGPHASGNHASPPSDLPPTATDPTWREPDGPTERSREHPPGRRRQGGATSRTERELRALRPEVDRRDGARALERELRHPAITRAGQPSRSNVTRGWDPGPSRARPRALRPPDPNGASLREGRRDRLEPPPAECGQRR